MLELGSQGQAVTNLQQNLYTLGVRPMAIDGDFGPQTKSAVIAFQGGHGLQPDGVVGDLTQAAIAKALVGQIPVPQGLTPWMDWMRSHLGEPEVTGGKATAFDNEVFSHTDYGSLDGVMDEGCAATACAALEETGFKSPHSARAADFEPFGQPSQLTPGCIVVFQWSNGGHHVTFLDHVVNSGSVACLGGNQSHEVNISVFSRQYIVATRWPVRAS